MRKTSQEKGWVVVSDTAWPRYKDLPSDIMAGYATIFRQVGRMTILATRLGFNL